MLPIVKLPDFTAVAAAQTAIALVPRGLTYHALHIGYVVNAVEAAVADFQDDFTDIRIKKDGRVVWQASGAEAIMLNQYYGRTDEAGVLTIWFVAPEARTIAGEDALAWGTAEGVGQLTVEIDIKAGTVSPALELRASRSPNSRHILAPCFADACHLRAAVTHRKSRR